MASSTKAKAHCSFCGKDETEVALLIKGKTGNICGGCLDSAYHVKLETEARRRMKEELLTENANLRTANEKLLEQFEKMRRLLDWKDEEPKADPPDETIAEVGDD